MPSERISGTKVSQSEPPTAKSSSQRESNALAKQPLLKTPKRVAILLVITIVVVSLLIALFVLFPRYGSLTINVHSTSTQGTYFLFVNGREWASGYFVPGNVSRVIHADLFWRGEECRVMIVELESTTTFGMTRTQSETTVVCNGVGRSVSFEFP